MKLTATVERWPVAGAFTIARGAKTHVDVVVVTAEADGIVGCGEATPIYYHGETADSVAEAVQAVSGVPDPLAALGRGAARNAVDAALWDHRAKAAGVPVWRLAGLGEPCAVETAYTISVADPATMRADATRAATQHRLLKLKLAGEGDLARVAAVREGAPGARLIVDANESWTGRDVMAEAAALALYGVELIEQPVKAGQDHLLDGIISPIPLCADESCQDRADLPRCIGRYAAVNVKLDKAGGLTEALALIADARAAGLEVMVGCMLSTSLGIAPALLAAQGARWVDLDAPLLLARDRVPGLRYEGGMVHPAAGVWGH
jgi:L-alanine-DL-glutamate epimerase-like enolase superfamily enzyme